MGERVEEVAGLLGAGSQAAEEYVNKMGKWSEWGDATCLHFLPDVIRRPIQVYALNVKERCLFDVGMYLPSNSALQGKPAIFLWYNGSSHYDLVSTQWLFRYEQ